MSISAHRVNSFDFETRPSFNIILDDDVIDVLESFGHYYEELGYRLTLNELRQLIEKVGDNTLVVGHLKQDLRWAEIRNKKYIYYYIVGDTGHD
jgi:hypothetical protein